MVLSESIAADGEDQYEAVDQVGLIAIPKSMEWTVSHKSFGGQFGDGSAGSIMSACNLQSTGAECD